jgi:hypothetical protein
MHGNEFSGPIKCWEVLEQVNNRRLLRLDSAPWRMISLLVFSVKKLRLVV